MGKKLNLIIASLLVSINAFTQKDSIPSTLLDQVIITANKVPQKQSTTGKVITVITKAQIEKSAGKTVAQLLNEQAGITINGALNNAGANQSVYLRGASIGRTLILLDGIPVYDPSFINSEFDLNLISMNDVERIEICKGAQSTLYGSDAVAGAINIITVKQNITKLFNTKATLNMGNYGTFKGNVQVYGKTKNLTYTARYARLSTSGFSAAYDSTNHKNFDNDGYKGDVANVAVQYKPLPSLSVKGFVQYSQNKNDLDAGVFKDEKDQTVKNKMLMTGGSIHYTKNNIGITTNYQYSESKRNFFNDSLDIPSSTKFSTDKYYGKTQFVEAFTNINLGSGFNLLQGMDYRFSSMNEQFYSLSAYGSYNNELKTVAHHQSSVYASMSYNGCDEKLNIELGSRLNVHSKYGRNHTFTFNPSYTINKNYRVFGSIASAFKAPTLYQLYSDFGNPLLKPEYSTTYEIGVQQQYAKYSNRIVYFNRIIKDGLDFDNNQFKYFNINKQTIQGVEWEGSIQPIQALTITLNYTYLKPIEQSQSRITFKDTTYNHLLKRPWHNFNINIGYQLNTDFYISASAKYVGKRYDAGGFKKADIALNQYILLNVYTEYKFMKWIKIFADAQNITNKKFFDVYGYNSIPFIVNTGITFDW